MVNDKLFNEKDGEQAFPFLVHASAASGDVTTLSCR
jgi:hypothetical protein